MSSESVLRRSIEKLRSACNLQTECAPFDFSAFEDAYARFLETYPQLAKFGDYLAFLRSTGGVFADNRQYSLVVYGFGGDVAPSFDEARLFLDRGRYFHFADFVRLREPNRIYILAFDLEADSDVVLVAEDGVWLYERFADSFCAMLESFAAGVE